MSLSHAPAVRAALTSPGPLTEVEHLERVGSTNDVARQRLADGVPPGFVIVADRQTAGRGRGGRGWVDDLDGPDGPANLAVTAVVTTPPAGAGLVPLVAGLAVVDAFEAAGARATLKWPNDVLLGDHKACGILVERHVVGGGDHLLIGCGIDVDWRGIDRDGDARAWTSLAEHLDGAVDRGELLGRLLVGLGEHLGVARHQPGELLERYRGRCSTLGREVTAELPGGVTVAGEATDVDGDGRLVVRTGAGPVTVVAGDVRHVRPAP